MSGLPLPATSCAPANGVEASPVGDRLDAYRSVIARKAVSFSPRGIPCDDSDFSDHMFPHQRNCAAFALSSGSAAIFLDTGLGKTLTSLAWAQKIVEHTNKPVLMLAPLAVSGQHVAEANRFGIEARISRFGDAPTAPCVAVTNYERLEKFDPADYAGVILDESSILKSFTGSTTRKLMAAFESTRFKLSCTATPAPNDHMEIGQQSQFLGAMRSNEMLSRWFIADQTETGRYRLKRAAVTSFWDWVASWARCVSKPSDLGFSDDGFQMPELIVEKHLVTADRSINAGEEDDGQTRLFRMPSSSATSVHREKRLTCEDRARVVGDLVAREPSEAWVVWCDTDYEADALKRAIPTAIEVRGSQSPDQKEDLLTAFSSGAAKHIITKPKIAGYGLNWQHCARMAFVGLSFSYESYYQAVRRCWRFRQQRPVHVHIACADTEAAIFDVVARKSGDHDRMKSAMIAAMRRACRIESTLHNYTPTVRTQLPSWVQSCM